MIKPSRIYRKSIPQSVPAKLLRFVALAILAPFLLIALYFAFMAAMGALWLILGVFGDPQALLPVFATLALLAALWVGYERFLVAKAYRSYISEQSDAELEAMAIAPVGAFSASDRKAAAAVLFSRQPS